jgi:iron complex transport system substrate-binding protein
MSYRLFTVLSLTLTLLFAAAVARVGAQDALTFAAADDLQAPLSTIYEPEYGAEPTFVEADADILVTSDAEALAAADPLPVYILPDVGLIAQTEGEAVSAFLAYAASADAQSYLIDAGLLPNTVTVTDQNGTTHEIPQPVRRVITPHSISTYMVYGVGGADRLVAGAFLGARNEIGAQRFLNIDPRLPELSAYMLSQREVNVEEVAQIAPDVIFTSTRSQWLDAVAELGIPVVLFQGETPEALQEAVQIVGDILGPNTAAHADAWVEYYQGVYDTVRTATADLDERPGVLFTGDEAQRVISGDMYQTSMIDAAGGISVTSDLTGYWNDVNLEQVLLWNPDVIFSASYGVGVDAFTDSAEWRVVEAVEAGEVYQMPAYVAPWDTPIPESVLGIMWMAETLYPDAVDYDCATETAYFYRNFYGVTLPEADIAAACGS